MERVTPVSRTGVERRSREGTGAFGDLTDVDVEEALTDELAHRTMLARSSGLSRRLDRFVRILDQTLGPTDRARHVETVVEAPEILRRLERLLQRGLGEAQGRAQSLELALIDLTRGHEPDANVGR
jgi:hypothetical protein